MAASLTFYIQYGERRSEVRCQAPVTYAGLRQLATAVPSGLSEPNFAIQHADDSGQLVTDRTDGDVMS